MLRTLINRHKADRRAASSVLMKVKELEGSISGTGLTDPKRQGTPASDAGAADTTADKLKASAEKQSSTVSSKNIQESAGSMRVGVSKTGIRKGKPGARKRLRRRKRGRKIAPDIPPKGT